VCVRAQVMNLHCVHFVSKSALRLLCLTTKYLFIYLFWQLTFCVVLLLEQERCVFGSIFCLYVRCGKTRTWNRREWVSY
jgi:hypothetical protein